MMPMMLLFGWADADTYTLDCAHDACLLGKRPGTNLDARHLGGGC